MVSSAKDVLSSEWITLKIADSTRSFNTQKNAYESGKPWVASPETSFHVKWQAIDLDQTNGDMKNEKVFQALRDAWLQQNPNERWHRSYGEFGNSTTTNQYQKQAEAIMAPNSKMTLKDVPEKQRAKVQEQLNKLQQDALSSWDMYWVMAASAWWTPLSDTAKQQLKKTISVINQLSDLDAILNKKTKTITDKTIWNEWKSLDVSPLTWWLRWKNPRDTDAQTVKAMLQATVPNLARWVYGEVWVLTDNDIANYVQTLPNLKQTKDVQNAILAMTLRVLRNTFDSSIEAEAAAGTDMAWFKTYYQKITDKIAALDASIWMGATTNTWWTTNNPLQGFTSKYTK